MQKKKQKKVGGKKFDADKPDFSLMPVEFLIGVAKAYGFGKKKYGADNYRNGLQHRRLLTSAIRHLLMELAGVPVDSDSGCEHWQNAGAALGMYAFMKIHRPDLDDRYKYTPAQLKLIEDLMYEPGDKKKRKK